MPSGILVHCVLGTVILLSPIVRAEFQPSFKRLLDMVVTDRCRAASYADSSAKERTLAVGNKYCRKMHKLLVEAPDYEQGDCFTGTDPECSEFKEYPTGCKDTLVMYRCAVTVPGLLFGTRRVSIHSCTKSALREYRKMQDEAYKSLKRKRALEKSLRDASNLHAYQFYETESGFKGQAPPASYRPGWNSPSRRTRRRQRVTVNSSAPGTMRSAAPGGGVKTVDERVDEVLRMAQEQVDRKKQKTSSRSTTRTTWSWKSWIK